MGFLISGRLEISFSDKTYSISPGDTIYLTEEVPSQWRNPDKKMAKLLWITIK